MRAFFADKDGNIVIAQKPNLPVLTWAATSLSALIVTDSVYSDILSLIAFGSLFTWAWLEIFHGDCRFRRVLGVIVLCGLLLSSIER